MTLSALTTTNSVILSFQATTQLIQLNRAVRAARLILHESSSYATDVVGNLPELLPTPGHPRLVDASHRIAVTRIELKIKTSLVQTSLRTAKNHLTLNLA